MPKVLLNALALMLVTDVEALSAQPAQPLTEVQVKRGHIWCQLYNPINRFRTCVKYWPAEVGEQICRASASWKGGGGELQADRGRVSLRIFGTDYVLSAVVEYTIVPAGMTRKQRLSAKCFDRFLGERLKNG